MTGSVAGSETGHAGAREPRGRAGFAFAAVVIATLFSFGFIAIPNIHNEYLALPIARELAFPGTYAPGDLIVTSGARAPFHLYHAAQVLYRGGLNVDLWWLGAFAASVIALFAGAWRVARAVGLSPSIATIATILLAVTRSQHLTVQDSAMPLWSFMSASVALPLALFAMADAMESRWERAAVLAGCAFFLHPGLGVIGVSIVLVLALFGAAPPPQARFLRLLGLCAVVMAPNAIYILLHTPDNFGGPLNADEQAVFRGIVQHALPGTYGLNGHGLLALATVVAWLGTAALERDDRRNARLTMAWLVAVVIAYAVLVSVWPSPALVQFYAVRATWFLKTLSLAILALQLARWLARGTSARWMAGGAAIAWILALTMQNPAASNAFALIGTGAAAVAMIPGRLGFGLGCVAAALGATTLAAYRFGAVDGGLASVVLPVQEILMLAVAAGFALAGARGVAAPAMPRVSPRHGFAIAALLIAVSIIVTRPAGRAWMPANPRETIARASFSEPRGDEARLFRWLRDSTPARSVVAVSPFDETFLPVQHVAVRTVYVSTAILAQLTYDVVAFREGARRLAMMGVRRTEAGTFETEGFTRLSPEVATALSADGVSFAVVSASVANSWTGRLPVSFTDGRWSVVDLRPLAPAR